MLDERLFCIADMMPPCRGIADVGTDHGFLICHLVEVGKAQWGVATDIHVAPLEKARREVANRGLAQTIHCLRTDGLAGLCPTQLDGVVIAGMGGETIAQIIENWPHHNTPGITWLLQPMTKAHRLRGWLWQNGFKLMEEKCCEAGGRVYSVLKASWTGEQYHPTLVELHLGRIDPFGSSQNTTYCQNLLRRTARQLQEVAAACTTPPSNTEAQQLYDALQTALSKKGDRG